MTKIGIHDLQVATAHHVLQLGDLADARHVEADKFRIGLGQDEMSVPAPDEDAVTLAASAALPIIERHGTEGIRTLFFATESGVDQSKSAGVFVHELLGLPQQVRVVELKQACYSATAGLQAAAGIVARSPKERVLVIASDVARYDLESSGEPTQGAGAVAMLVSADPALIELEPATGVFTSEINDFWRPNDSTTAVVEGKLSISAYLDAMTGAWDDLQAQGGPAIDEIDRLAFHQPFTRMATKALRRLAEHTGTELDEDQLRIGSTYNRRMGNSYTASLYSAVASLLHFDDADLSGKRMGMLSYGSGSVAEFFTGIVQPGYREATAPAAKRIQSALDARERLSVDGYAGIHKAIVSSAEDVETPRVTSAPFRFAGIRGRARMYEATR